jgi:ABC-2 type transport system ATP-binding protein
MREFAATGAPVKAGRIDELLELVGLRDRASDRVQNYSLGMKQRLAIAVALLSDPRLLLLDEPANGLDPAGIVAVRDMLRELAGQGKTIFVSSHLLAEVQAMADVVGIISAGRLVREGPLRELLALEGTVKVRVRPDLVPSAVATLSAIGPAEAVTDDDTPGSVLVHIEPSRAEDVSRILAGQGIYVAGLEAGTDLEMLFLELTGGQAVADQGAFGPRGAAPASSSPRDDGSR